MTYIGFPLFNELSTRHASWSTRVSISRRQNISPSSAFLLLPSQVVAIYALLLMANLTFLEQKLKRMVHAVLPLLDPQSGILYLPKYEISD